MNLIHQFLEILYLNYKTLLWRDIIEIFILWSSTYYVGTWLKGDRQKNLLGYFLGYWAITMASYFLHLQALFYILIFATPCVAVLFIVLHQETLQRNFILLKKIKPIESAAQYDWVENLIRSFLYSMNNHKSAVAIIEQSDELPLSVPFILDCEIDFNTMTMILDTPQRDENKMFWIKNDRLRGFNAELTIEKDKEWVSKEAGEIDVWKQDALLLTQKSNALAVGVEVKFRSFSIIAQGQLLENINVETALRIIRNVLTGKQLQKEDRYAIKSRFNQKQSQP